MANTTTIIMINKKAIRIIYNKVARPHVKTNHLIRAIIVLALKWKE